MGGEHDRLTAAEAASVIGWWIEAGVDVAIQEQPRAWLGEAATRTSPEAAVRLRTVRLTRRAIPPASKLSAAGWRKPRPCRSHSRRRQRVLPMGVEAAEVMLLADMPTPEDVADGQPIAGTGLGTDRAHARCDRIRRRSSLCRQPHLLPQSRHTPDRQGSRGLRSHRSPAHRSCEAETASASGGYAPIAHCSASRLRQHAGMFTKLKGCAR